MVHCESQQEVDHYWNKLVDNGQQIQCGWLKDKFGLAWQIVPTRFFELIKDPDPQKAQRVIRAMFGMVKFEIGAGEGVSR